MTEAKVYIKNTEPFSSFLETLQENTKTCVKPKDCKDVNVKGYTLNDGPWQWMVVKNGKFMRNWIPLATEQDYKRMANMLRIPKVRAAVFHVSWGK
jgi:GH43 family beta-xylosidase